GADCHIRFYHVARTGNCVEACAARRARRHRGHAHVCRSHPRKSGTRSMRARQRVEGCGRRRWRNRSGAATPRGDKLAAERRWFAGDHLQSKLTLFLTLFVGMGTTCLPLNAHHGSASYKTDKLIVMKQATVTKFLWSNPHSMLLFDVKDGKGRVSHWAGEAGSPSAIRPLGWNKNSLQPGD